MRRVGVPARCLVLIVAVVGGSRAHGQEELGPEDRSRLNAAAEALRPATFLVGAPGLGHGSGFVLSRSGRLLVTNAHVADVAQEAGALYAVRDGQSYSYRVDRVWYHPEVIREFRDGLMVRTPDRAIGEVEGPCADVALIQLADGGPDLPAECRPAGPGDLRRLVGRPVGRLGFSGAPNVGWPEPGRAAQAVYATGKVTKLAPLGREDEVPVERRQEVEYSAMGRAGDSGGPIFLADGRVVAICTGARVVEKNGKQTVDPVGVRIDCLWELIAYHRLEARLPLPEDRSLVRMPKPPESIPMASLNRAIVAIAEARRFAANHDYRRASQLCNEAIGLVPRYGAAYIRRSAVHSHFLGETWRELPEDRRLQEARWALDDARRGLELNPGRTEGVLLLMQDVLYLAGLELARPGGKLADSTRETLQETIEAAGYLLGTNLLAAPERSFASSCRAQARLFLGDLDGALADYNEAIRLSPSDSNLYGNRALYWETRGRSDLAARDRATRDQLRVRRAR